MTREEFFTNLCKNYKTEKEMVAAILFARGFLIEPIGERYYLSDNAHEQDAFFLAKAVEDFQIGKVNDTGMRSKSKRRSWNKDSLVYNYKYDSLVPMSAELIINDNTDVNSAMALFDGLEIKGGEAGASTVPWAQYTRETLGPKVELAFLEPYIALYVKAASSCGIYTASSCDGNHPHGGKIYVEADSPSNIWHECLWELVVQPRFGRLPYIGKSISYSDKSKYEIYSKINEIASFLYNNRLAIRALKMQSVEHITRRYRAHREENEIKQFYTNECRRVLTAASGEVFLEKGVPNGII